MIRIPQMSSPKIAQRDVPQPSDTFGVQTEIQAKSSIFTYFTVPGPTLELFAAPKWITVKLLLETAGPVAVSTKQQIGPTLSGKGQLLPTGQQLEFTLYKGDRLYIVCEAVNRVAVTIESIPWLEQILLTMRGKFGGLK